MDLSINIIAFYFQQNSWISETVVPGTYQYLMKPAYKPNFHHEKYQLKKIINILNYMYGIQLEKKMANLKSEALWFFDVARNEHCNTRKMLLYERIKIILVAYLISKEVYAQVLLHLSITLVFIMGKYWLYMTQHITPIDFVTCL